MQKRKILLEDSFSINKYQNESKPIEIDDNFRIFKNENNEEIYKLIIHYGQKKRSESAFPGKKQNYKKNSNVGEKTNNPLFRESKSPPNSLRNNNILTILPDITNETQITKVNKNNNGLNQSQEMNNIINK